MLLPAEIESKVTIPLLRAIIAKKLVQREKFTQEQVAKVLGITQAAVSNYLRGVRGWSVDWEKNEELNKWADRVVEAVLQNEPREEIARRINEAVKNIRSLRMLCEIHKKIEPEIDVDTCKVCD
ncbi:MAG: helix-turn-helix domain-containing protein [Candidatus Caldarchaeum sp.]|nr:helix-turn-helix domain-containing protein [Candidatus Caldarchaeum sp.]MDW7977197.1 helix-turn-helix domain-containing protein [Candidatus Caldarchaeum sp.]MDW8360634.1 helix-turn-helix domain-containing protein [Candidatus Caldarchaeum sp.]